MPDASESRSLQLRGRPAANRFVELLTGNAASPAHWRIKQDVLSIARDEKDDRHYALNRYGTVADLFDEFDREQSNYRSPFLIVNEGGHKSRDITRVRAVYIDMDGGTKLADVVWHIPPHFIVARSARKFHAHWLCDIAVDQFRDVQKRLIAHYGSDAAIHDLSRVMRVPGFNHLKDPEHPNPVVLVDRLADVPADLLFDHRLDFDQVTIGLPELPPIVPRQPSEKKGKPAGLSIVREMASWINFDKPHTTPLGELSVRDGWMQSLWAIRDAVLQPDLSDDERLELCDDMSSGKLTSERTGKPCEPLEYDGLDTVADAFNQQPTSNASNPVGIGLIETLARLDGYSGPPLSFESLLDDVPSEPSTADDVEIKSPDEIARDEKVERRRGQFHLRSEAEQNRRPPRRSVTRNVLYRGETTIIYGEENSFKSFVALDLSLSACAGIAWAAFFEDDKEDGKRYGGFEVDQSKELTVLYIAGEAVGGIETARRPAWRQFHKIASDCVLRFYTVENMPRFHDDSDVALFVAVILAELGGVIPDIIVIDTVARALAGLEENSAKESGLFIDASDRLKRQFDCAMVHVHHTDKSGKWARGSYRLITDAEVRIRAVSDKATRTLMLTQEKNKDAAPWPEPVVMVGKVVAAPGAKDEDGKPVTSLAFKRMTKPKAGATIDEVPTARSVLGRELARVLQQHPGGKAIHAHVVEGIMFDRLAPGGSLHGRNLTDLEIARQRSELNNALRQAAKPRKRGSGVTPAALGNFLAAPWTPGAVLFWRLPASASRADGIPDDDES